MVDTIDLTYEEEHWLKVFSKINNFFRSLNYNFKKFRCLTENQYLYLEKEIEKAEDNGYIVLSKKDERIFRELAKEEAEVRMLLKKYSNTGYFDKFEYELFLNLMNTYISEDQKKEIIRQNEIELNRFASHLEQKSVKIPCPHCSFLCLPQVKSCKKCGEPLPKIKH